MTMAYGIFSGMQACVPRAKQILLQLLLMDTNHWLTGLCRILSIGSQSRHYQHLSPYSAVMKNSPTPGARDLAKACKSKYRTSEKPPKSTEFWDPWGNFKPFSKLKILLPSFWDLLFGKGEEVSNFVKRQATSGLRFWGSGRLVWRIGFCPFFDAGNLGGSKRKRFLKQVKYLTSGKDWQTWYKSPIYSIPDECPQDESCMSMKSKVWNISHLGCLEDCEILNT